MPIHLSRSTGDSKEGKKDLFEKYAESPNEFVQKMIKQYLPDAEKLKATMNTAGWKDVIEPFLEHSGNAERLFGLREKVKSDYEYERISAKVEAYNKFLKFVRKIVSFLELAKKEEEKG